MHLPPFYARPTWQTLGYTLKATYTRLLKHYLQKEQDEEAQESVLYQVSLLAVRMLGAGYGPEDVVELHSEALTQLAETGVIVNATPLPAAMNFLLEVMIAYGVRHREQIQYEMEASERRAKQRAALALAEAEERLRQNRQRLQDRDDFVGFIAHELRRPLTTIQGRATLGQRYADSLKSEETFLSIYQAAEQMGDTLDLLLQLSRQERDYALTSTSPVSLEHLLHDALSSLEAEQRAKELSLAVEVEPPPPVVEGDEAALRAVFENLISNAIKYNRKGGQVLIRTRHAHDWVQVEVEDSGVGIPTSELPHIFNRYYRIKKAGSSTDGSGLGLALVEYIVHQHGGHIGVSSEEGAGSRFVVQLPRLQSPDPAAHPPNHV